MKVGSPECWLGTVSKPARGRGQQHGKGQGKGGAQADGHGLVTISRLMTAADEPLADDAAAAAAAAPPPPPAPARHEHQRATAELWH